MQTFTQTCAAGMAPWHVGTLVMTAPLCGLIGADLFLGKRMAPNR